MKLIKKTDTKEHKNSDQCIATEHSFGDKDFNFATIKLTGRYPSTGKVVNQVCKEIAYIEKGTCKLVSATEELELSLGDGVLIEAGEAYFWEGEADLVVTSSPAWYPEQHRHIV